MLPVPAPMMYSGSSSSGALTSNSKVPTSAADNGLALDEGAKMTHRILNGFMLLDASGVGLPEDSMAAALVEKGLVDVNEEDMQFFTGLEYLDVSENNLNIAAFQNLSSLVELRLACNNIFNIGDLYGFESLQRLDLSYNKLTVISVQALQSLPNLRELDLCGNDIKGLPIDMFRFASLEKILLEHNKIDDNNVFAILSSIPKLRYVSVAYNFLSNISPNSCNEGHFPVLDTIDISFNYFGTDKSIESLVNLPALMKVMLYGNPLLGPTGEDALQVYIEDLVNLSIDIRIPRNKKEIEFITEVPRHRGKLKKGQVLGRQATYRDFNVVKVNDNDTMKSSREWRSEGAKSLFAEAVHIAKKQNLPSIKDATFLTAASMDEGVNTEDENTALIAEIIMSKVAKEMNIGTKAAAELKYLEEKATINTIFNANESSNNKAKQYNDPEPTNGMDDQGMAIPNQLFTTDATDDGNVEGIPIDVYSAVKSLRYAVANPLTDYYSVPSKGFLPSKGYVQPTKLSLSRQVPTRRNNQEMLEEDNRLFLLEHLKDLKSNIASGLPEPVSGKTMRHVNRQVTMDKIDDVLNTLNQRTDEFTKALGNTSNKMNENIEMLQEFARPNTGENLKKLLDMVNDIIEDLND